LIAALADNLPFDLEHGIDALPDWFLFRTQGSHGVGICSGVSTAPISAEVVQHAHIGSDPISSFSRSKNPTDWLLPNRTSHLLRTILDVLIDRQGKRAQHEVLVLL
jgi:hypothetical protein